MMTNCVLTHRRIDEDGTPVWDHELARAGAFEGALLCKGHLARLREVIAGTPEAISWMRTQLEPAAGLGDGNKQPNQAGSKMPISAAAVDSADETIGLLFSWAQLAAEELHADPPDMSGTWKILASKWTTDGGVRVQGIRGNGHSGAAVDAVTRWLLNRLDEIVRFPWIEELVAEVVSQRETVLARWPYTDRVRPVPSIDCEGCGKRTVVIYPPSTPPMYEVVPVLDEHGEPTYLVEPVAFGKHGPARLRRYSDGRPVVATEQVLMQAMPVLVQCSDINCGETVPESKWGVLRRLSFMGTRIR